MVVDSERHINLLNEQARGRIQPINLSQQAQPEGYKSKQKKAFDPPLIWPDDVGIVIPAAKRKPPKARTASAKDLETLRPAQPAQIDNGEALSVDMGGFRNATESRASLAPIGRAFSSGTLLCADNATTRQKPSTSEDGLLANLSETSENRTEKKSSTSWSIDSKTAGIQCTGGNEVTRREGQTVDSMSQIETSEILEKPDSDSTNQTNLHRTASSPKERKDDLYKLFADLDRDLRRFDEEKSFTTGTGMLLLLAVTRRIDMRILVILHSLLSTAMRTVCTLPSHANALPQV
ncbi:hypothetical protein PHISCL_04556 [Aspergillus sclerotialis]|uniref:Uncharacterized protein n=1 Tax=Aspergillus sclerotialis TaxID=2070753 RepID=A0A3A2ZIN4_9EURO|nr:hypothetical protein PHISCL_04556 [Aspergillus sclerotialis]